MAAPEEAVTVDLETIPFVVITYQPDYEEYARGCRMGGGSSQLEFKNVVGVTAAAEWIGDFAWRIGEYVEHLHVVLRDFRGMKELAQHIPGCGTPNNGGPHIYVPSPAPDFDAEDWDVQVEAETLDGIIDAAIEAKAAEVYARVKDNHHRLENEKKAAAAASADAARKTEELRLLAKLKEKYPE